MIVRQGTMSMDRVVSRRGFLRIWPMAAASGGLLAGCGRVFQPRSVLSPEERRLVEALADQVIPPDEAPGGRDAGVAEFIERQLRGPYARHLAAYHDGLAKIDSTSRRLQGRPFVSVPFARQTALLEALETDRVPDGIWKPKESSRFFQLVIDHCLQGFYGSPRHGGNRDGASWRMLGLNNPQILGRVIGPA